MSKRLLMADLRIGVVGCGVFGGYHVKKYKGLEATVELMNWKKC